jgi:hypothetical protein
VEGKKDEWIVKILRAIKVPGYKSHNYYLRTPYIPAIADEELKGQRIEDVVNRWHAKVRETVQERGGNKPLDDLLDEANLDIPCSPLASAHELFETVISIHAHRIHRIPISEHCLPGWNASIQSNLLGTACGLHRADEDVSCGDFDGFGQ